MDTFKTQAEVERLRKVIKDHMPKTYESIKARSSESDLGRQAFALVTRGLRGEPNMFWAMEAGHVVGTPFTETTVQADVAALMVQFGACHAVIWSQEAQAVQGVGHGQN